MGLTSSCTSWLRHDLGPFGLSFHVKHSIPTFIVRYHIFFVLSKISTITYTLVTTWKRVGSEHRNPEENGTSLKTGHRTPSQQHAVSSLCVRSKRVCLLGYGSLMLLGWMVFLNLVAEDCETRPPNGSRPSEVRQVN